MNEPIYLPYHETAKWLIQEGDVLLFRGTGIISWTINVFTQGKYSHAAFASWHEPDDMLECIEFRASGGRTTNFEKQLQRYNGLIDVYRPIYPKKHIMFNAKTQSVEETWTDLDKRKLTDDMRSMTGLPYGWARFWWLMKLHMGISRFIFRDKKEYDDFATNNGLAPVCSTAVAICFSKQSFDLVKNRSDHRTTPNDLARSPLLEYMFTPVLQTEKGTRSCVIPAEIKDISKRAPEQFDAQIV